MAPLDRDDLEGTRAVEPAAVRREDARGSDQRAVSGAAGGQGPAGGFAALRPPRLAAGAGRCRRPTATRPSG